MAAISATALVDDSQTRRLPVLHSVAIAEPIVLPALDSATVAQLIVHTAGTFELVTAAASAGHDRKHFWGAFAEPPASTASSLQGERRMMIPDWLPLHRSTQTETTTVVATVTAASQHGSGYLMHPAVLDATLHLSAAAAPSSASQRVRAPTSLAALSVPARAPQGRLTPLATPQSAAADAAITCSFLISSPASGAILQIAGLVVKDMPVPVPARPAAAAKNVAEPAGFRPATNLLYETVWQVSKTAGVQLSSSLPARQQTALRPRAVRQVEGMPLDAAAVATALTAVSARSQLHIDAADLLRHGRADAQGAASTVATAVMHGIELLRRHLPSANGGAGLRLATRSASPPTRAIAGLTKHAEAAAASGAALAALMRVAATENPSMEVGGLDTGLTALVGSEQHDTQVQHRVVMRSGRARRQTGCTMTSTAEKGACVTQDAGTYGEATSGGAHFLARLLRSAMTPAPAECHLMPVPRGALSDLKFVPLEHGLPPPGSVKVIAGRLT